MVPLLKMKDIHVNRKKQQGGFTLIELMVTVGIVAILAAIAIPAYSNYTVRAKVSEGVNLANSAETAIADGYQNNGMAGVTAAAIAWDSIGTNNCDTGDAGAAGTGTSVSKWVTAVCINKDTGAIHVYLNGTNLPQVGTNNEVVFSPNDGVGGGLADGFNGSIDWACGSQTHNVAAGQGLTFFEAPLGTGLLSVYAPSQCT